MTSQLNAKLMHIDSEILRLLTLLEANSLRDKVNIMIFSDHGMTGVSPSRVVNVTAHVTETDILATVDGNSQAQIWPRENKTMKV
jgi:ectonucleotide pyrophosphatase/phosphodiesterase family protein 6